MTSSVDNLDALLSQARAAARSLADELEFSLALVLEEESLEVDLQPRVLAWNRARTELAMAVFGESTLQAGGLAACEIAIVDRRRAVQLEEEYQQAKAEIRYLEQSPSELASELSALLESKRERVAKLEAELSAIQPPKPIQLPKPAAAPQPNAKPAPPVPVPQAQAKPAPSPKPVPAPRPKRCGVCLAVKTLSRYEDRWRCATCLHLEEEIALARRALAALGEPPLEKAVPSEVPGMAKIRAEGRDAIHALASRRRQPSAVVPSRTVTGTPRNVPQKSAPALGKQRRNGSR
ncbi:hypothetical protein [Rhodococcus sp. BE178]|uniref:hypothetical protein n=1 Tax=Rhodococcus sp. BE178 TaxID=2817737 RepID=UPI003D22B2F1